MSDPEHISQVILKICEELESEAHYLEILKRGEAMDKDAMLVAAARAGQKREIAERIREAVNAG